MRFDHLQLGLGTLTISGVKVVKGPLQVLSIDEVVLVGWPWAWGSEGVVLRRVELRSPHLRLERSDAVWSLPPATQALLSGTTPWSEVQIGLLRATDLVVEVDSPEASFRVEIGRTEIPDVVLSKAPVLGLSGGRVELMGLTANVPDHDTLRVERGSVALQRYQLGDPTVVVKGVVLEENDAQIGPEGWAFPGVLARAFTGSTGISWPQLELHDVQLNQVDLAGPGGWGVNAATVRLPALKVMVEPLAFELEGVDVGRWSAGTVAKGDWAKIDLKGWQPGPLGIPSVTVGPLQATLDKNQPDLGIPSTLWTLARFQGYSDTSVARVHLAKTTLRVEGATVPSVIELERGAVRQVRAGTGWSFVSGEFAGITIREGERQLATVSALELPENRVMSARGIEVFTGVSADRHLVLPSTLLEHLPGWIGGTRSDSSGEPWFGIALDALPWQPQQVMASGVQVHLKDAYLLAAPVFVGGAGLVGGRSSLRPGGAAVSKYDPLRDGGTPG